MTGAPPGVEPRTPNIESRAIQCAVCLALVVLALAQAGCTFFTSRGGGPLARAELGDWAGIPIRPLPERRQAGKIVARLERCLNDPFSGEYVHRDGVWHAPTRGATVRWEGHPWLFVRPGARYADVLCLGPTLKDTRKLLGTADGWGLGLYVGDFVHAWRQLTLADVATQEPVAVRRVEVIGTALGYVRTREVWPAAANGKPSIRAALHPGKPLSDVRYGVRDGTTLAGGLIGWGRVNHTRYVQVLWLPIPLGPAGVAAGRAPQASGATP